jgi:hypothetical protein
MNTVLTNPLLAVPMGKSSILVKVFVKNSAGILATFHSVGAF